MWLESGMRSHPAPVRTAASPRPPSTYFTKRKKPRPARASSNRGWSRSQNPRPLSNAAVCAPRRDLRRTPAVALHFRVQVRASEREPAVQRAGVLLVVIWAERCGARFIMSTQLGAAPTGQRRACKGRERVLVV
jgi:hypothetical protein